MTRLNPSRIVQGWGKAAIFVLLGALLGAGTVAVASADGEVIDACVDRAGNVRIADKCRPNETPLQWSITGPVGPQGPEGPQGDPGPMGPGGPQGDPGVNCWDRDGDGIDDPEEDTNGDGAFDALDCQGPGGSAHYFTIPTLYVLIEDTHPAYTDVLSASLPAGNYVIMAGLDIACQWTVARVFQEGVQCRVGEPDLTGEVQDPLDVKGTVLQAYSTRNDLSLQGVVSLTSEGTITLQCAHISSPPQEFVEARNVSLIAIEVDSITITP